MGMLVKMVEYSLKRCLRNDETIISSISVTDIVFDVYLGKWNYRAIPKVKTWSYFLIIPKLFRGGSKARFMVIYVRSIFKIMMSIGCYKRRVFLQQTFFT